MATRRSYVIVTSSGRAVRHHRRGVGRHRLAASGRSSRPRPAGPPQPAGPRRPRRGRHRRAPHSSLLSARSGTLVVLLGTVGISGWFTATGAAALAQMLHP